MAGSWRNSRTKRRGGRSVPQQGDVVYFALPEDGSDEPRPRIKGTKVRPWIVWDIDTVRGEFTALPCSLSLAWQFIEGAQPPESHPARVRLPLNWFEPARKQDNIVLGDKWISFTWEYLHAAIEAKSLGNLALTGPGMAIVRQLIERMKADGRTPLPDGLVMPPDQSASGN